ncbi:MAG TPA: hypothetical protein VKQ34_02325, partial [Candidatus Saccharimonadales bacterium]|nr:hypothetical protein [Candidatus Saccharimonadales bacterium]
ALMLGATLALCAQSAKVFAFDQNRVIDDAVFDNVGTMSANDIDAFLNQFGTSCISTNKGFSAPDPTGYAPNTGFTYGGNVSAGTVIAHAAQAYQLNPQVLLATLQKEQGLPTGGDGCSTLRYVGATGYGCPDSGTTHDYSGLNLYTINGVTTTSVSGTCVNAAAKAGFSQQVIHAAWLLKFGEQRSEGNISWAIINGNWNNSDDPQTCYGGPMTQGRWQVCPSGPTVAYDGFTTIDGTAVHMDTGATASLYWYTPHFHGNQVFWDTFNGWFGSTQVNAKWLRQSTTTGQVWLVAEGRMPDGSYGRKKYKLTSWAVYQAWNLGTEPVMPVSDAYLAQFDDEGTLGTMASGVEYQQFQFIDGGKRYYIPDITPCAKNVDGSANVNTTWGLDCFNTNVVKVIPGTEFIERIPGAGPIKPLMINNNTVYRMAGGQRLPIYDGQTLADLGYTWNDTVAFQDINAWQPIGPLQISHAAVLSFNGGPFLLYDNTSFKFYPMDGNVFTAWQLYKIANPSPAVSSFNSSPPAAQPTNLTIWATDGTHKYLIDGGRKVDVTSMAAALPGGVSWQTYGQGLLNALPTAVTGQYLWVNGTGGVYQLAGGTKHHVPNWSNFVGLGLNFPQLLPVSSFTASQIPDGDDLLADGSLFQTSGGVFMVNGGHSYHVPSWPTIGIFGLNPAAMDNGPDSLNSTYPNDGDLKTMVRSAGGAHYIANNGGKIPVSSDVMAQWGLADGSFVALSDTNLAHLTTLKSLGKFFLHNGGVYYAQGGQKHYVQSFGTFAALGGDMGNLPSIEDDLFNAIPSGSSMP